jgi:hypothetical protein
MPGRAAKFNGGLRKTEGDDIHSNYVGGVKEVIYTKMRNSD